MTIENTEELRYAKLEGFDTVLLDMDGTLLDLAFDNFFWRELVPRCYARSAGVTAAAARDRIYELYAGKEGSLDWYCLDFWSRSLGLDLAALKSAASHRIAFLPGARDFLLRARRAGKRLVLVTNAHPQTLAVKQSVTGLHQYVDELVSSHTLGFPKEDAAFWPALEAQLGFDPATTLFVDDSLPVLNAAAAYGLAVVAIRCPDTRQPPREIDSHRFVDGVAGWL